MRILAIETSCDETALAIVEADGVFPSMNIRVLADNVLSQVDLHKTYGGVFPMIAKREHARALVPLLIKTLTDAGLYRLTSRHVIESPLRDEFQEILEKEPELFAQFISSVPNIDPPQFDAIAITRGPGLEPALWVGINFAKALSMIWKVPIIAVNHMEGHMLSALLAKTESGYAVHPVRFPTLGLLVSGGHTELVYSSSLRVYRVIGETRDDAVGEAFDKVARILGLPYPGGPEISQLAEKSSGTEFTLPRPMMDSGDYDFSFSGLKTAVLYLTKKLGMLSEEQKADIAREFEEACVDVLVTKTLRAIDEFGVATVLLGGGVSANKKLRRELSRVIRDSWPNVSLHIPDAGLSTDNALMIAVTAIFKYPEFIDVNDLRADGNWAID